MSDIFVRDAPEDQPRAEMFAEAWKNAAGGPIDLIFRPGSSYDLLQFLIPMWRQQPS